MASASILNVEPFVFDPQSLGSNESNLKLTGKRYSPSSSTFAVDSQNGLILILAHGSGHHKEVWEPTLEKLFSTQNRVDVDPARRIHEAWALDWLNHGESALVNAKVLEKEDRKDGAPAAEWGSVISAFIKAYGFPRDRTIGIAHSAGAAALLISTKRFGVNNTPFKGMIIAESVMISKDVYAQHQDVRGPHFPKVIQAIKALRATWKSKDAALEWLKQRPPYSRWDPRIQKLYVEHAMYAPDSSSVALKCPRYQEVTTIADVPSQWEAAEWFGKLGKAGILPIHFVFGTRSDFTPPWISNNLFDTAEGRIPASITKIEKVGHYVLQEKPDELAVVISDILNGLSSPVKESAKL